MTTNHATGDNGSADNAHADGDARATIAGAVVGGNATELQSGNALQLGDVAADIEKPPSVICHATIMPTTCKRCAQKGFIFYTENLYTWQGRLIRTALILLASFCTIYVCVLSSDRYFHSWVQTVIERTDVHVSEIAFPAVTICPVRGINLRRLAAAKNKFLAPNHTATQERDFMLLLQALREIDATHIDTGNDGGAKKWHATPESADNEIVDQIDLHALLQFMSFDCEDLLAQCSWRHSSMNCCNLFRRIHTYKGVCYAFNSLLVEEPNALWPWRSAGTGPTTGLQLQIKRYTLEKIVVMVHDPSEQLASEVTYLDGERVSIAVHPVRFSADNDIASIAPPHRHCYFAHEMKLLGSSQSDCIRNCRMSYIERKCNCSFHRAQMPGDLSSERSGSHHIPPSALLSTGNIIEEINRLDEDFNVLDCQCYPYCNYIQYETSVYVDTLISMSSNHGKYYDMQVHYQHETFFSYRSVLVFTWLDLIVSYGGIAGLFLGFSLMSIIEACHQQIFSWRVRRSLDQSKGLDEKCVKE